MSAETLTTADLAAQAQHREPAKPQEQESQMPLLAPEVVEDLRSHWDPIQTAFVDDPRTAVKEADELVATAIKRLAEGFAEQRRGLESQWGRGDDVSTEELRLALRKYREFFKRLLTI